MVAITTGSGEILNDGRLESSLQSGVHLVKDKSCSHNDLELQALLETWR